MTEIERLVCEVWERYLDNRPEIDDEDDVEKIRLLLPVMASCVPRPSEQFLEELERQARLYVPEVFELEE